MAKVKKLGVNSFMKFQGVICLAFGMICGLIYSVSGLIIDLLVSLDILSPEKMGTPGLSYGTILAFGAVIGMPLLAGAVGAVLGLIESLLYNLIISRWFEIDFEIES